jgi:DNA-binding CsgD family transcriptional regulator
MSRRTELPLRPNNTDNRQGRVRLLLREIGHGNGNPRRTELNPEEVVIDIDVDGFRYMLVRMPLSERTAHVVLSPREQEIARMVAKGHHNKTIADVLTISSWTVCTHLRRIFAKLGVNSRAAMVARLHELEVVRREARSPADAATPGVSSSASSQ